ncbi:NAD(P)H-binding protein [Nocardia sp. XZ_19_385]|uniref:NAD(P)H-binding protein n=1 Tax=Nocardia sp. XZ_19_385 TaxID=2769488 RepID=UPI00188EFB32|nr:NAD(P)H-binding protein [Nocardia sp. XZ_19_385]
MILITGGRGTVATELRSLLIDDGHAVRIGSARPDELDPPAAVCDLKDPSTFAAALDDVSSVFLYANATHISEFVTAATEAGVDHIVLLSSSATLDPDATTNPVAKAHLDAELGLADAPMTVTVLRPGAFAGNARGWAWSIRAGRPVNLPYPNAYADPIHERDIAAVAHALLTRPDHRGRGHTLTGPQTLTFTEQLELIGTIIDRPVEIAHVTPEAWRAEVADFMPAHFATGLLDYWARCDGVPTPLSDAVEVITGHPARPFAQWVQEHRDAFAATQ